jgi:hypothetical protein
VEWNGVANGSNSHAWVTPNAGASLRDGALDPQLAGPLGSTLIHLLADPQTGLVLDSWIDSNGANQGDVANFLGGP